MKKLHLGSGALALMLGACAEAPKSDDFGYNGTGIAVSVAPLTLDALADACYSFAITNEAGQLVVGRGPGAGVAHNGDPFDPADDLIAGTALDTICASQFGNTSGGDVSYVAPCDADEDKNGDGNAQHTVHLWVDALCEAAVTDKAGTANWEAASPNANSTICNEIQAYQNPCGSKGCQLTVTCEENADTPVTFNFTIMGQADQGFFDIAVNFQDIFCSAKLDTCYAAGEVGTADDTPINLLFTDGVRSPTAVLALACTAGADSANGTMLHLGNVVVTCNNPSSVTTLNLGTVSVEGNQIQVGNQTTTPPLAPGETGLNWAAWFGSEQLGQGGTSWNKEYFNIGITNFGPNCSVTWAATATDGQPMPGVDAPSATYTTYPVVNYGPVQVTGPLTGTPEAPTWLCSQNPINGPDSEVVTNNVGCTDPGGCLQGPCITTQGGDFFDCEAGSSPVPKACGEMPQIEQAVPLVDACPAGDQTAATLASTVDTHLHTHLVDANAQLGFLDRSEVINELEDALGLITVCDPLDIGCESSNGITFADFEQGGQDLADDLAEWLNDAVVGAQTLPCGASFTMDTQRFCDEADEFGNVPECIWDGVPLVVSGWSPAPGEAYLQVFVGNAQLNPFDIVLTPNQLAIVIDFYALRQSLLLLDLPAPDVFTGKGEIVLTPAGGGYNLTMAVRDSVAFQINGSQGKEGTTTERYRVTMPDACPLLGITAAGAGEDGALTTNFFVPTVTGYMPLSNFDGECTPDPFAIPPVVCVTSTTEVVVDFAGLGGALSLALAGSNEVLTGTNLNAGGRPSTIKAGTVELLSLDSNAAETDGKVSFEARVIPPVSPAVEPTWNISDIVPFWRLDAIFNFQAVASELNNMAPWSMNDVASVDVQPASSSPELEYVGGTTPTWKVVSGSLQLQSSHLGQTILVVAGQCLIADPPVLTDPHPFDEFSVVACP